VHAHAEHGRALVALGVHHVEGVAQVFKELVAVGKALGQGKAHVVGVEGVGHHQVGHAAAVGLLHLGPEGQVVTVVVRVIQKAAVVGHQTPGVGESRPVYQPRARSPVSCSMMAMPMRMCSRSVASSTSW
jgi:hypothetical protein